MIKTFKVASLIGSLFLIIGCTNPTNFREEQSEERRRQVNRTSDSERRVNRKGRENRNHENKVEENLCDEQKQKLGLCESRRGGMAKRIRDRGFPIVVQVSKPTLKPKKPPKQVIKKPVLKADCNCKAPLPAQKKEKPYVAKTKVDFIVVVDSSHSMSHFLRNLKSRFQNFIKELDPLDWRMIFTNADHGGNAFLFNGHAKNGHAMSLEFNGQNLSNIYVLEKDNLGPKPYAETIFIDTIGKHISPNMWGRKLDHKPVHARTSRSCKLSPGCGGGNEEPLKALQSALKVNKHLLRPDAHLSALIISDSEEGRKTKGARRVHVGEVLQTFEEEFGEIFPLKTFMTYGIVMLPNDKQCQVEFGKKGLFADENVYSYQIAEMAEVTRGFNVGLCEKNYAPLAKRIATDFQKLELRMRQQLLRQKKTKTP